MAISNAKREMRAEVCIGLLAEEAVRLVEKPFHRAHVTLTLRWFKRSQDGLYRPEDAGNAIYALKAAIDGIVDAGLLADDDYTNLVKLTGAVERCDAADEGLLVQVEELCPPYCI